MQLPKYARLLDGKCGILCVLIIIVRGGVTITCIRQP